MMPPPPSITDVSSASANFTAGAKNSGLNIAAPMSTPSWIMNRIAGDQGGAGGNSLMIVGVVAVVAVLGFVLLKRK